MNRKLFSRSRSTERTEQRSIYIVHNDMFILYTILYSITGLIDRFYQTCRTKEYLIYTNISILYINIYFYITDIISGRFTINEVKIMKKSNENKTDLNLCDDSI